MTESIIYEWQVPADHPGFTGTDDLPRAYRVIENERAAGGIVIEALYGDKWQANPWSVRLLVRHLLGLIPKERSSPSDLLDTLEHMREHGSSVLLNWGEDNDLWECSWITGGNRFTACSKDPLWAVLEVMRKVRQEKESTNA